MISPKTDVARLDKWTLRFLMEVRYTGIQTEQDHPASSYQLGFLQTVSC